MSKQNNQASTNKTIIFDFDGTIANTLELVMEIANEVLDDMKHQPITTTDFKKLRKMTIPQGLRYLQIPAYRLPKMVLASRQKLNARIHKLKIVTGMRQAIKQLKKDGWKMGILTTNSLENVEAFLERNNLSEYFEFIDSSTAVFGKSTRIRQTIRRQALDKSASIYVGDEIRDVEASQQQNLPVVAVSWGANSYTALKHAEPDKLITKPQQLVDYARKLDF